jgi:type III secretion protein U
VSDEKTEKPTDKKIEDAREKGQVPVSKDLARLVSLLVVAEIAFGTVPIWSEKAFALLDLSIMRIGQDFQHSLGEILTSSLYFVLGVFAMFLVVCSVVAFISHWGQFGVLIEPKALEPKFDKLNPINGFKQMFEPKKLAELLMTVIKATLIGWLVYTLVRNRLPVIIALAGGEPKDIFSGFVGLLQSVFHVIVGLCFCLALADFGMQKYFHVKQLMMDKDEIKREHKEMEGDPLIKGKRKQLARQWANSAPAAKTEKANAVVVNPTHFAVAMLYDPDEAPVPVVLAKGKDDVAQAMIERAKERGIPVIRHVWLARTLYATCRTDTVVPRASYEAVANVYAVVAELVAASDTGRSVELESLGEPPESYLS